MNEFGTVKKHKLVGNKTQMLIEVENKKLAYYLDRTRVSGIEIKLDDPRRITAGQNGKIHALIRDIGLHTGYMLQEKDRHGLQDAKKALKETFIDETGAKEFSTSDCSVTLASGFINFLVEFVIREGVQTKKHIIELSEDVNRAIFCCIAHRKCIVTGFPGADIHHCTGSRVGMGSNRNAIDNAERYFLPLSREWHTNTHIKGERWLYGLYKVRGVKLNEETMQRLGLNLKEIDEVERIVSLEVGETYDNR